MLKNKVLILEHFFLKIELYTLSNNILTLLKFYVPLVALLCFAGCKNGESLFSKSKSNRPSPPAVALGKVNDVEVKIEYSSPRVKQRQIWDGLVPYGKLWRTGANEATTLSVNVDTYINDQLLPKGKYSLFTIPNDKQWTIIINKVWDLWGSYDYDISKDVMRLDVAPYELEKHVEKMTFSVAKDNISFKWEKLGFDLSVRKG